VKLAVSWRRRWEPLLLLTVALAAPATLSVWLVSSHGATIEEPPPAAVPHGEVLYSPRESRALSPRHWLALAVDAPQAFGRALRWCERRQNAPLPNCRNVVVTERVCRALASDGLWGGGDG